MDSWKLEKYEIGEEAFEEMLRYYAEEEAFAQDMEQMEEFLPSDEEIEEMARYYGY